MCEQPMGLDKGPEIPSGRSRRSLLFTQHQAANGISGTKRTNHSDITLFQIFILKIKSDNRPCGRRVCIPVEDCRRYLITDIFA